MSISTFIIAYTSENNKDFQKHKKILEFCLENKVSLPKETAEYFENEIPDISLLDNKLEIELEEDVHYQEYYDDKYGGYEIDLEKLPNGVSKIRFLQG